MEIVLYSSMIDSTVKKRTDVSFIVQECVLILILLVLAKFIYPVSGSCVDIYV